MKYAKVYAEDVQIGTEMPALVKPPVQQIQLTRYAGASGDFNPIHQDAAFAKAELSCVSHRPEIPGTESRPPEN